MGSPWGGVGSSRGTGVRAKSSSCEFVEFDLGHEQISAVSGMACSHGRAGIKVGFDDVVVSAEGRYTSRRGVGSGERVKDRDVSREAARTLTEMLESARSWQRELSAFLICEGSDPRRGAEISAPFCPPLSCTLIHVSQPSEIPNCSRPTEPSIN